MSSRQLLLAVFCLLTPCLPAHSQSPTIVPAESAAQHLTAHPDPFYPPIAKAAHIYGLVVVQASIDETGHVTEATPLSGPAMLLFAGTETVKKYIYTPFLVGGKPAPVTAIVPVEYVLNGESRKSEEVPEINFLETYLICRRSVSGGDAPADQVNECRRATQQADSFAKQSHWLERRGAYIEYATALLHAGKFNDAVIAANQAVDAVKHESQPMDYSGTEAAYQIAAEAQAANGKFSAADYDLTKAEKIEHQALRSLNALPASYRNKYPKAVQWNRQAYTGTLTQLLELHAKILEKLGDQKAADAKRAESAKLSK